MTVQGWLQIVVFFVVLTALTPLLGGYMARVFTGERVFLTPVIGPLERLFYRILRTDPEREQDWKGYARTVIVFNLMSFLALYLILRTQGIHPFNPEGFKSGPWDLSFNTAASFVTNTNWQFYAGETTLSNFAQMAGLAVQNFVSAAVGIAVLVAVIRGFSRRSAKTLGNFWTDLVRTTLYVLLPISVVGALVLVSQGVIQTLGANVHFTTLTGAKSTLAVGPVASQEVIKELGTNGGGFFNVNSAMPFENPTALTSFVEALLMLLVPAALVFAFGRMVGQRRQARVLFAVMMGIFLAGTALLYVAELHGTPALHAAGVHGAALEGKEVRFGAGGSALFAGAGTASGDGAVNSALESLTGLGAIVPTLNIMTGEVVFGGPGAGMYSMLLVVLVAVFIAGLMVGRTPEYLGKKLGIRETKLAVLGTLAPPMFVLLSATLAVASRFGRSSIFASGPQGFAETFYAYLSQANNNGSAYAGYTGFFQPSPGNAGSHGITFADLAGGIVMLLGRFGPIVIVLALAGALAAKRPAPAGRGTLRTDTPMFGVYLAGFVVVYALLTFVPALLLGPSVQALTNRLF